MELIRKYSRRKSWFIPANWEGQDPMETLVTVEFREVGDSTEVELTHELFPNVEKRDKHNEGWMGCFDQLAKFLN